VPVPKEIELKLEVPPANLPRLAKIPRLRALKAPAKSATEISVYFDTKNRKLHKKGLMLRVRRGGDRYVQTIKSAGHSELFERDEWESEIDGAMPEPAPRSRHGARAAAEPQILSAVETHFRDTGAA
jgi:inorganic triphosphatase YgiF